jgi:exodeoxyribonuclease VII small subunit
LKRALEERGGMTFEEALSRLEEVVRRLETSEIGLDESLALFQEGMALSRLCHGRLEEAERKIEKVLAEGQRILTVTAPELEEKP